MTAQIITLAATTETETAETIAARCIAAGMDGKIINTFAIARAVARAIQTERDQCATYRKRCAELVTALAVEREKWKGEWG